MVRAAKIHQLVVVVKTHDTISVFYASTTKNNRN